MLQKLKQTSTLLLLLAMTVLPLGLTQPALAAPAATDTSVTCPDGKPAPTYSNCAVTCFDLNNKVVDCDKVAKVDAQEENAKGGDCKTISKCNLMIQYVYPLINFLAALVGIAVTVSIIIGGVQYGSSAGDPQKTSAAKNRIRNSIIALVTFIFLYALLNFLIPGGLFQ